MDPLRFLTAATPAPLPGLGGSATAAFAALPGLVSWVTLDPAFTGAAEGARITTVTPRSGAGGWTLANGSTGPVAQMSGSWMGAKFTNLDNDLILSPSFTGTTYGVALVVYSDGSTDATKNRQAAAIEHSGSDKTITRAAGKWNGPGAEVTSALAASAGYQLVICDLSGGVSSTRARDATITTPVVTSAWAGIASARLALGGSPDGLNNSWHASVMEAWVFDNPILTSPARLTALDDYFGRIYL